MLLALGGAVSIQAATNSLDETAGRLVDLEKRSAIPQEGMVAERPTKGGRVYYVPGGRIERSELNRPTQLGPGDKLETLSSSQVLILTPSQAAALGPDGLIQVIRPQAGEFRAPGDVRLSRGKLYFKSLRPADATSYKILLPGGELRHVGTEFVVDVTGEGEAPPAAEGEGDPLPGRTRTDSMPGVTVRVLEGSAEQVGENGAVTHLDPGPIDKHLFNNSVQWCLYYPAVLFADDLSASFRSDPVYQESLRWYRTGAVQRAWAALPPEAAGETREQKLYAAAVLLALGDVERTQALLAQIAPAAGGEDSATPDRAAGGDAGRSRIEGADSVTRLTRALSELIAAVKFDDTFSPSEEPPRLATEWLARSYFLQAMVNEPRTIGGEAALGAPARNIERALEAALNSVRVSAPAPASQAFAYGWAQVAALEFSRGRIDAAAGAIQTAIALAPSNAAPYALQGFLHAARERTGEAEASFRQAVALNGKLGDAWLGLGLMSFRQGDPTNGLGYLQIAVVNEPQRSMLRSYLGKGYYEAATFTTQPLHSLAQLFRRGETNRADLLRQATNELRMARLLDPNDPTPDLYSALIHQQENRIHEAIRELERSKELNDNRRLYRSGLLLDRDQAVRSVNLAAIYRDAGLVDWSVREAARAVNSDYANFAAHLFLANSYDTLRDPRQVALRYETPWFGELLLANLLQPVGAGTLSQTVSQHEYSRLFDRDQWGLNSGTEYLSTGDWSQYASHFGTFGRAAYSLDAIYSSQTGPRANEDISQLTVYTKFKQQLTQRDSILFQGWYYEADAGDVGQRYDGSQGNTGLRFTERQEPNILLGYHREWSPQSRTLLAAARLHDRVARADTNLVLLAYEAPVALNVPWSERYQSEAYIYSAELQQIWQNSIHTWIAGGRVQYSEMSTDSGVVRPQFFPGEISEIASAHTTHGDRQTAYAYYDLHPDERFHVVAGLTYDRLRFPRNIDFAPIVDDDRVEDQFSPKAGFIWQVSHQTWLRGAYTRSLGGVYHDASVRIEPVQVAGFTQAFRSAIPESVDGVVPGSSYETWGLALEHRFATRTYLGVLGEILESSADRQEGAIDSTANPLQLTRRLDFGEKTVTVNVTQLLGDYWTMGAQYRLSQADLSRPLLEVPLEAYISPPDLELNAVLHNVRLFGVLNTPAGFYAQVESVWHSQENRRDLSRLQGDDFWQHNAHIGWRFARRRADVTLGCRNLFDGDYRLHPISLHASLPRERTWFVRLRLNL